MYCPPMHATATQKEGLDRGTPRQVSRARWAAIGAAVAVSIGAGGVGLTHAISNDGGSIFVPITPCRLFDTRPAPSTVGPRSTKLDAGETYTQQVTGNNGQCTGIPADATAVAMNVTAVDTTAASYLTVFPADGVTPPNSSNLNWIPGAPPTPNKVDVKLSPTGAIKLYNNVGTVNVLADVVGYYQDHNHDNRYPRKLTIPFSLAAGGVSDAIPIPPDVAVSLAGVTNTLGESGVGQATLFSPSIAPNFVEWTGQNSPSIAASRGENVFGYSPTIGTHIVLIDYGAMVDVEVHDAYSIQVHNKSAGPRTGFITLIW